MGCARRATAALAIAITSVTACGCQTTAQRSAELQRAAKHELLVTQGVSVKRENPSVRVVRSTVLHTSSATAVVLELRNTSSHALENAPVELSVKDARGAVLYQNSAPGLEPSLTKVSLLAPGRQAIWVDDQVQAAGTPTTAQALVGTAITASRIPKMSVVGARLTSEAGAEASESGSVANHSSLTQANLVVYAVARRAGRAVAAGRAVLPEVAAGASVPFQIYFVGNPQGAQIEVSAPATTF
ncbi:MAG TPA: hypothetical protein VNY31_06225 [Solirubrobacteraceae bacterium]|jgi:hypothetical protein|nr:hypothetical protein [Solirubrobacteraceae bacterium]